MERLRLEKEREDKEEADKMATMKIGDRQDMSHNSQIYTECQTQSAKVLTLKTAHQGDSNNTPQPIGECHGECLFTEDQDKPG